MERSGRLTGETSFRHGPTFPPTWRIYFTAVSDTLIPESFRGAFRFASTDFHIVQCFEFHRCFSVRPGFQVTVPRTGRDTRTDRSVVKASKSLNVVPLPRLKLRGIPGTSFYQFQDKRQRLSVASEIPKIGTLRFEKLFSFVISTPRDVSKYLTLNSYKLARNSCILALLENRKSGNNGKLFPWIEKKGRGYETLMRG